MSTDEDIMNRVASLLGVSPYRVKSRNSKWKPTWRVILKGKRAVELMEVLRPLMGERRQGQIDAAIHSWNPVNGHRLLSPEQVREVRALKGVRPASAVGPEFEVSKDTVYKIWQRVLYADVM